MQRKHKAHHKARSVSPTPGRSTGAEEVDRAFRSWFMAAVSSARTRACIYRAARHLRKIRLALFFLWHDCVSSMHARDTNSSPRIDLSVSTATGLTRPGPFQHFTWC